MGDTPLAKKEIHRGVGAGGGKGAQPSETTTTIRGGHVTRVDDEGYGWAYNLECILGASDPDNTNRGSPLEDGWG